jgi:hypothetical protein
MKMTTTMLVGHHFVANPLDVDEWELLLRCATVCQRVVELEARASPQRHAQKHSSIALSYGHSSGVAVHDRLTRLVVAQSDHHPTFLQHWLQIAARALECRRHRVFGGMPRSFRDEKDAGGAVAMTLYQRHQCDTHLVNHSNLLDGSKRRLAQLEVHVWAKVQWFDDSSLDAIALVASLLQTNIVERGGKPADVY